jgi:hypothetical protein
MPFFQVLSISHQTFKQSPAHLHKGVTYTVYKILTFIKRLTDVCLQSLHHRFVVWTKPDTPSLLLGTLTDLARSKSELVAANALLRQQLVILRRQVKRPTCTKTDRMLLVLLARMVRTWKQVLFIVQPETLLRWHHQGFKLYWKYKSRAASSKPKIPAETVALIKEMAAQNWRLVSGADPRRITQVKYLRQQTHHSEIHATGACHSTKGTELENLPALSCQRNLGL